MYILYITLHGAGKAGNNQTHFTFSLTLDHSRDVHLVCPRLPLDYLHYATATHSLI